MPASGRNTPPDRVGSPAVALAVTPGRDPDETPDDRLYANLATAALIVVAIAFVVWLVWVYLL
jgi:hypothetical protein